MLRRHADVGNLGRFTSEHLEPLVFIKRSKQTSHLITKFEYLFRSETRDVRGLGDNTQENSAFDTEIGTLDSSCRTVPSFRTVTRHAMVGSEA